MKIVATSDFHGSLPPPGSIPACDVLVIAGDMCPSFDHRVAFQRKWLETVFADWLEMVRAKYIIGIGGNHDFILDEDPQVGYDLPWIYLMDEQVEIDGVRFYGIPWVPNLSRWAFHLDDPRLDEKFSKIPFDTHVVVSHGPPFKHCDYTVPKFGSAHVGFPGANATFERVEPEIVICGHIHEAYGWSELESGARVLNVSHMTENYEPVNPPVVLERFPNGVYRVDADFPPTTNNYDHILAAQYGY